MYMYMRCMCVYIYMCVDVYIYICMYVYTHIKRERERGGASEREHLMKQACSPHVKDKWQKSVDCWRDVPEAFESRRDLAEAQLGLGSSSVEVQHVQ